MFLFFSPAILGVVWIPRPRGPWPFSSVLFLVELLHGAGFFHVMYSTSTYLADCIIPDATSIYSDETKYVQFELWISDRRADRFRVRGEEHLKHTANACVSKCEQSLLI